LFIPFKTGILPERVNRLGELGVQVLLCGAISRPLERMIRASGVKVIPCLRGSIEEIIGAYLNGDIDVNERVTCMVFSVFLIPGGI
jgi:predicted Fe-Mo cluster-binding NifX family protein